MTISTTIIKNSYSGDGSVVAFTYAFKITDEDFIEVIVKTDLTGTESVRAIGTGSTNYAVTGVGEAGGGTVTFVTAPTSAETVVLRRSTTQTQALDLIENDNLPANSLENAFDKNLSIAQELQEQLDRSFKVSRTNTISSAEFTDSATARASKTLGFNSDGNLTTVADFLPAGGDSAQFTYSTTTTDADPGAGFIRFNNATIASATIAYIDDAEANGTDVSAWVQSFDDVVANPTNRGRIRVSKANTLDTWHVFRVNAAVTDASGYTKIPLTYIDGAGSLSNNDKVFVSFVSSGEDGVSPGYFYKFATSTTDGDPGAGLLRFDNSTYANVTEIYIDDADQHGGATNVDTITWGSSTAGHKGFIQIVDVNDKATYVKFKVTGVSTDASGYNKLTVVHVTSNGTFSAADELSVHFTASGNDGAIPGYEFTFDSSTTDADPGAGDIRLNNGTYADVTRLFIDDADANGGAASADVLTWGASDSVIKGFIHISDTNDHSTYARFKVTAAVTDASGYNKITVVHLTSNNTFSAGDNLSVHFTRNGDFGSAATIEVNNVTVSTVAVGGSATATVANAGSTSEASLNFAFGIPTGATGATGDVSLTGTQTLTNKTLTAPVLSGSASSAGTILFKEDTDNGTNAITLKGAAATADVTLTLPAATDTLVGKATTDTFTNKTLTAPKFADAGFIADANGNELVVFQTTGSAVNELEITNNASGSNPILAATGGDTNIGIALTPKGTGEIVIGAGNLNYGGTAITSTGAELNLLDGVSGLVQADLTKLAAIDATAAEIDTLDALSRGSIIYGNASAATAILTKGSAGTVLTSDGTDLSWAATPITGTANGANNRITTYSSGTALNGEANLTFDGSTLVVTGAITATGDVTAFQSSDRTMKENIKNIENPLDKINKLNGVYYDWTKETQEKYSHLGNEKEVGVIAQDVEKVLPEIVATREDGTKAVKYERLCAVLIEAVKELQEQIKNLKNGN